MSQNQEERVSRGLTQREGVQSLEKRARRYTKNMEVGRIDAEGSR
ncbi:MAG: hypothetical protein CM15mP82_5960 [Methanobacteriota archaeon]|nr:MAG: hypothetical protein CM15mP82_5960 [Euryarchaeota archaeon]